MFKLLLAVFIYPFSSVSSPPTLSKSQSEEKDIAFLILAVVSSQLLSTTAHSAAPLPPCSPPHNPPPPSDPPPSKSDGHGAPLPQEPKTLTPYTHRHRLVHHPSSWRPRPSTAPPTSHPLALLISAASLQCRFVTPHTPNKDCAP